MARVLALDVGSSAVRARVYRSGPEPAGDLAKDVYLGERDPDRLVGIVRATIAAAKADDVDAIGISCFGHSLLALDGRGRPLTPILGWRDAAGHGVDALAAKVDAAAVHARTGCHLHTSYWPAKLAWLASEQPEVFKGAARFAGFADYLAAQLLGGAEPPSSLSLASGTGLLDVRELHWDAELLDVLGLEAERLPAVSDESVEGAYPALLDGACSNLGLGALGRKRAALMIGTSGAFRTVYETDSPSPRPGLFLYRLDARRVVEGGALSDGGNLYHWLQRTLASGRESVADPPPAAHGLTFLTLLGGERSPGWKADVSGAIAGLTFATTPLDLRQAGLEGVAYRFAEVAALMPEVEEIVATGGPLRGPEGWIRVMADVLERPVELSAINEASLRGAAIWALERLGEPPPPPAPIEYVVQPRPERYAAHRAARERQRRLYDAVT